MTADSMRITDIAAEDLLKAAEADAAYQRDRTESAERALVRAVRYEKTLRAMLKIETLQGEFPEAAV